MGVTTRPAAGPGRFRCRRDFEVRARTFDGTLGEALQIIGWVERLSDCRGTAVVARSAWSVEINDTSLGCLELHAVQVLVWTRPAHRWSVCGAAQFSAWFEPTPRELPIYDDGEVV